MIPTEELKMGQFAAANIFAQCYLFAEAKKREHAKKPGKNLLDRRFK
jgi:hypothetical protein